VLCICKFGDQINVDEMGGHVTRMGEIRNVYKTLDGKPGEKRVLGIVGVDGKITLE
jgi:hypothetical protein